MAEERTKSDSKIKNLLKNNRYIFIIKISDGAGDAFDSERKKAERRSEKGELKSCMMARSRNAMNHGQLD